LPWDFSLSATAAPAIRPADNRAVANFILAVQRSGLVGTRDCEADGLLLWPGFEKQKCVLDSPLYTQPPQILPTLKYLRRPPLLP
jgi:hypothetical protein